MPTVLDINGYKFKFYSNENNEEPHIHITKANGASKYWLSPKIMEEYSYGFTIRERRDIKKIITLNNTLLLKKWNDYFNK